MNAFVGYMVETAKMPRRRRMPRFRRVRRIGSRMRRTGRRARRGIGSRFGSMGEIAKGGLAILAVRKVKQYFGFHIGDAAIDRDVDMIIAGLVGPHAKLGNSHLVPAGASQLVADLADGFIFGGGLGTTLGGAGGSNFAGPNTAGNFAGE